MKGRSIAVFADTGEGKTTQFGELAKFHYKRDRRQSILHLADKGGYASLNPLVKLGVVEIDTIKEGEDPWGWIDRVTKGLDSDGNPYEDIGVHGFDSGTGMGELLLSHCADLSAAGMDIGGRPAPKFKIKLNNKETLNIGSNVDSHYGVVQSFLLKKIWQSTYLTEKGSDVYWTFAVLRGEDAGENAVLGPMMAGKALTPKLPKWFDYTFRLGTILEVDSAPKHVLYLTTHLEGMNRTLGNSRYPIDAVTKLPDKIEPASIITALELFEQGEEEAENALREELGM